MKKSKFLKTITLLVGVIVTSISPHIASASVLLSWGDGVAGFGDLAMDRNDDDSSGEIVFGNQPDLAFDSGVNFFGNTYNSFYVNNNGNITFNSSLGVFTPDPFPISSQPMIAPFWADVDTRCDTCGEVYIGSPNENTLVMTWDHVGFYSQNDNPTNTFQLVLIDRSDTGAGNFDVEFRYEELNWTTGEASGGDASGLGGTPAQAGYDAGDLSNFYALPGSFSADILDLQNTSNTGVDGVWTYSFREGELPGNTPANPVLPIIDLNHPGEYQFELVITEPSVPVFIDPDVAIGYDYIITDPNSPLFASVILPTGFDDNLFDLWLWNVGAAAWFDSGLDLVAGVTFDFINELGGAIDRFRILGIDTANMVDPLNPLAFVTGLTFDSAGQVVMSQNVISEFVAGTPQNQVPEPSTLTLLFSSALMLLAFRRKKRLN